MRLAGLVGAAVLISGLGITVPAYSSQRGDQGDSHERHERQEEGGKPGKGDKHHGKQSEPARERVVEQHGPQRLEHAHQGPRQVQRGPEQRVVWQQHRASRWAQEHRDWKQRGGYHGYHIPHNRYVVYFGEHRFRVNTLPVVVVGGHPRFHYHGCWFTLVDPLPEYWSPSWYETDEVYVEYVHDGYYMRNMRHPGVAIAINVSL